MNRWLRRRLKQQQKRQGVALARYLTRWIDVPHEPGERFQFRMPNWTIIEEARAERRRKLYGVMRETREVVGAEMLAEWRKEQEAAAAVAAPDLEADPDAGTAVAKVPTAEEVLNEYDRLLLLTAGIGAWTYCEPLLDEEGNPRFDDDGRLMPDRSKPIKVTPEAVKDLDEHTQQWAGLTLVALVNSGFRPALPDVIQDDDGTVIEVRPGVNHDPFAHSSNSRITSTPMTST